jgi:hypothetical protein
VIEVIKIECLEVNLNVIGIHMVFEGIRGISMAYHNHGVGDYLTLGSHLRPK